MIFLLSGASAWAAFNQSTSERLVALAIKCVKQLQPNHIKNKMPSDVHAIFYGCYDWHSSVHSHFTMIRFARLYPKSARTTVIRRILRDQFTAEKIDRELQYLEAHPKFEVPYGYAWFLQMMAELHDWNDKEALSYRKRLAPLEEFIAKASVKYLNELKKPVEVGTHDNTAFAMEHFLDYAAVTGHVELQAAVNSRAREFFQNRTFCDVSKEPQPYDFISPCLAVANLMTRVIEPAAYNEWASNFLAPKQHESILKPFYPGDDQIKNYQRVHQVGLLWQKAWSFEKIAASLAAKNKRRPKFQAAARKHNEIALGLIYKSGYGGTHWLASFAAYYGMRAD